MESKMKISNESYDYNIPAVIHLPETKRNTFPAVILCHGTASQKDEVGNMFVSLAEKLAEYGIVSIRFDFAGCGDSKAKQEELTFYSEVSDTEAVYEYLLGHPNIDSGRIGILGFSQGARVMAEFLGNHYKSINAAVSLSGACHNGEGVFKGWFEQYHDELKEKEYVEIPMEWRKDLILSRKWFNEIRESKPMEKLEKYKGNILAVAGTDDKLVPFDHTYEIIQSCNQASIRDLKIVKDANHIINCLDSENNQVEYVLNNISDWISRHI